MAALATPLDETGAIDTTGLGRLVAHILAGGADGLCPAGSTGEGPLLSLATRIYLVEAVAGSAPAGTPVIPGTLSVNPDETLVDIESYAKAGATAVLVPPPFYYPLGDGAVADFFGYLAKRSPLPVLLYNIPAMTKVSISPSVVADLAGHGAIAGMKDSSRDMEYFCSVASAVGPGVDFDLLTGSDTLLLASLASGAKGTIAASVNLVPGLVSSLYKAAKSAEPNAGDLQRKLADVVFACRKPGFPAGWKAALKLAGLCEAHVAAPMRPATEEATKALAIELESVLGPAWNAAGV